MSEEILVRKRKCPKCRYTKTIGEFPKDKRFRCCLACMPGMNAMAEIQARQEVAVRRFLGLMSYHDVPTTKRPPKTDEMLVTLMEEFGGMPMFVHELAEQMKLMAVQREGHPETVRLYQAVLKLVHENNKRQDAVDQSALTREQIEQAKQVAMFNLLTEATLDKAKAALLADLLAPMVQAVEKAESALPAVVEEPLPPLTEVPSGFHFE